MLQGIRNFEIEDENGRLELIGHLLIDSIFKLHTSSCMYLCPYILYLYTKIKFIIITQTLVYIFVIF